MEKWLLMQTFYHRLFTSTRESVDAAAGGAFLSLNLIDATSLIEKMTSNQGWNEECVQPRKRGGGMHQLKEADMVSAKLDLIMKKLEARDTMKKEVMHISDSRMTCEECGDVGHSGVNYLEFQEDVNYINNNNNYRPQQNQWNQQQRPNYQGNYQGNFQGNNNYSNYNQPPLRDLVAGQSKLLDQMSKKVASSDKVLENINSRMDTFASAIKN
jgi:hypothetical protein